MPIRLYRKHVTAPVTVTTAGSTGQLDNLSKSDHPTVMAIVSCGTVTGTTPSMTPQIDTSEDGTNWFSIATGTAMTTSNAIQRIVATDVILPYVRVSWPAPTGTTPNFANVTVVIAFN